MKRKLIVLAILTTFILPGCSTARLERVATMDYNVGTNALNAGEYWGAERKLKEAINEGHLDRDKMGPAWNNLGLVYEKTGRQDDAVAAFTMAARYGSTPAGLHLLTLNKPVPPVDLGVLDYLAAQAAHDRRVAEEHRKAQEREAAFQKDVEERAQRQARERQAAFPREARERAETQAQAGSNSGFGDFLLFVLGALLEGAAEGYANRPTPATVVIRETVRSTPAVQLRPIAPVQNPIVHTCTGMVNGQWVNVTCF